MILTVILLAAILWAVAEHRQSRAHAALSAHRNWLVLPERPATPAAKSGAIVIPFPVGARHKDLGHTGVQPVAPVLLWADQLFEPRTFQRYFEERDGMAEPAPPFEPSAALDSSDFILAA